MAADVSSLDRMKVIRLAVMRDHLGETVGETLASAKIRAGRMLEQVNDLRPASHKGPQVVAKVEQSAI